MQNTSTITRNHFEEPPTFIELFMRLQAMYRSQGVHTVTEWPMHTTQGRAAYRESRSRDQFLAGHRTDDLKHAIARAVAHLETMPKGQKIDFNELVYGQVQ